MAPGDCSPGAPTDPDVQNSRIRLFGTWVRYAGESVSKSSRFLMICG